MHTIRDDEDDNEYNEDDNRREQNLVKEEQNAIKKVRLRNQHLKSPISLISKNFKLNCHRTSDIIVGINFF